MRIVTVHGNKLCLFMGQGIPPILTICVALDMAVVGKI